MKPTKELEIIRCSLIRKPNKDKLKDLLACESILELELNSKLTFEVVITPEKVQEFVYGYLYSEGFIKTLEEIKDYSQGVVCDTGRIKVKVTLRNFTQTEKEHKTILTGCGTTSRVKITCLKNHNFKISSEKLCEKLQKLNFQAELFKLTGAFHYAFLLNKNLEVLFSRYDIGRHNAVDKVLGAALLSNGSLEDKILFSTGRITSDIVMKSLRAKIPILISRAAPLYEAVLLARKYNLCLIGFLRGKKFNVYSCENYISINGS
jgi:FdhD protein